MWGLSVDRLIEMALLMLVSWDRITRWIYRRETNDKTLHERVVELEDGWDDKVDAATVQELQDDIEKARKEFFDQVTKIGDTFHRKLNDVNTLIGKCATQRDADILRREIEQLRTRIDDHIDRKG
jgi:hypothetical protein